MPTWWLATHRIPLGQPLKRSHPYLHNSTQEPSWSGDLEGPEQMLVRLVLVVAVVVLLLFLLLLLHHHHHCTARM